jgi:hypothetical protein
MEAYLSQDHNILSVHWKHVAEEEQQNKLHGLHHSMKSGLGRQILRNSNTKKIQIAIASQVERLEPACSYVLG